MPSLQRIKAAAVSVLMWTIIVIAGIITLIINFASSIRIWIDLGIWHFVLCAGLGVFVLIISLWRSRRAPAPPQKGTSQ
jgi:hypothetical protein